MEEELFDSDDFKNLFNENDINIFDERRNKRLKGESKIYSWQQAKAIITA